MSSPNSPEPALARWISQGVTSRTHRILQCVLGDFFTPLGIEAESLEAEPFSALEAGHGAWWLRQPRWNSRLFDRSHASEPDFSFLIGAPDRFDVSVDPQGRLFIALNPAFGRDPDAIAAFNESEQGWRAARHAVRAAEQAEAFIFAAAALLLANDPAATVYAGGHDDAFCQAVRHRLAAASCP
jgi:hypothetical protein